MGGMGSLRLALRNPDVFSAVTAIDPAIEPAFEWADVESVDRFWRSVALIQSLYGNPPDASYRLNNPASIVRSDAERIKNWSLDLF